MTFREVRFLVISDIYRYYGDFSLVNLLRAWLRVLATETRSDCGYALVCSVIGSFAPATSLSV
jgi:hypothetical protein